MRRRHLLALAGTGLSLSLAGCQETFGSEATAEAPSYDCESAYRPPPTAPGTDDGQTVAPLDYPDRPNSLSSDSDAIAYVEDYERAYQRNRLLQRHGSELHQQNTSIEQSWTFAAPADAAIVRVQFSYGTAVEYGDEQAAYGDSWGEYATYYVDQSAVVRTGDRGEKDDPADLGSDPWESASVLECFE
ncbi:hypothetical protein [Haloarchaeobius sp. DFWS5]|uniref:hypothetical protein n=1 Tax=Haloarchaeobius sp. DFWS5 TaxID=3446114 RepID=UPI003EC122DB